MPDLKELFDFDMLMARGENVPLEVESSAWLNLLVPVGSIPGLRRQGTEVGALVGTPLDFDTALQTAIGCLKALGEHNIIEGNSGADRRVMSDIDFITFETDDLNGTMDVDLPLVSVQFQDYIIQGKQTIGGIG